MALHAVPEPDQQPHSCAGCERLAHAIGFMEIDLQNAEVALRAERRQVTLLKGQLETLLDESAEADEVKEIFQIWKGATNHPKSKLLTERKKLIARMLKQYGRDRCVMAVLGVAADAYTNPQTGVRYDQIKHVFGDEERFERYEEAGRRSLRPLLEAKRRSTEIGKALKQAGMAFIDDDMLQVTHFKCPICPPNEDRGYYPLIVRYDGKAGYCRECFSELPDVLRAVGQETLFEVAA